MTVMRDAVIRIRTERAPGAAGGPSAFETRAYKAEARAASEAGKDLARSYEEAGRKFGGAFREGTEGALRFTRGVAFMAASTQEDLGRMTQQLAAVAGGVDILAGGVKVGQSLAAVFGGPVGIAMAATTAAVGAGAVMWAKYRAEAESAAEAAKVAAEAGEKAFTKARGIDRQFSSDRQSLGREGLSRFTGLAFSADEQQRRIDAEQGKLRSRLSAISGNADLAAAGEFIPEFRRPIRGTPARQRRIEEQRRQQLEQTGDAEALDAASRVTKDRNAIAERLIQLEREEVQLRTQMLNQQRAAASEAASATGGIFGHKFGQMTKTGIDSFYDKQIADVAGQHQKVADTILKIWQDTGERMLRFDRALQHLER